MLKCSTICWKFVYCHKSNKWNFFSSAASDALPSAFDFVFASSTLARDIQPKEINQLLQTQNDVLIKSIPDVYHGKTEVIRRKIKKYGADAFEKCVKLSARDVVQQNLFKTLLSIDNEALAKMAALKVGDIKNQANILRDLFDTKAKLINTYMADRKKSKD